MVLIPVPTSHSLDRLVYPGLQVLGDELAYKGRFSLRLVTFTHQRFDGTQSGQKIWEVWQRPPAIAVLPYDPWTDQVVVMDQFRMPALVAGVDPVMVEIPAGQIDPNETAEQTAYREMEEEAGLHPDRLEMAGNFVLSAGGLSETCAVAVGRVKAPQAGPDGVVGFHGLLEEQEDIRVRVMPAETAIADALAGRYPNSVTTLALLWFAAKRSWLQEIWKE